MRWQGRRGSRNIEDRRRMGGGGIKIGGLGLVIILIIGAVLGIDVRPLLNSGIVNTSGTGGEVTAADERAGEFVSVTLADTEEVWADIFQSQVGRAYDPVTLVLFKGATQSQCGGASAQTGPFYCPLDEKVYLDTDFFDHVGTAHGRERGFRGCLRCGA